VKKILLMTGLILSIVRCVWAIEPEAVEAYLPRVARLLTGESIADAKPLIFLAPALSTSTPLSVPVWNRGQYVLSADKPGTVAILPLEGAVMKSDYCGAAGTQSLSAWMRQVDSNPNFIGSILDTDSPGGAVDGTDIAAATIKSLSKPVVTFVNSGMMCSAAYWIGSSARHIMSNSPNNTIGSIGTYCSLTDYTEYYEKMGIKMIDVYADKSTHKNKMYRDAKAGDDTELRTKVINPINDSFHAAVRSNRYGKGMDYKDAFTGKTYQSDEALSKGLIDSIGGIDDAISLVQKLSKS
jgi:protease-4